MHGNALASQTYRRWHGISDLLVLQYNLGVCSVKINTCAICGKEYDMHMSDGRKIIGIRPRYCSDACRRKGKRQKELERQAKQKGEPREAVQIETKSYNNQRTNTYYMQYYMGPLAGLQCFGCPFIGEECRNMVYPMCRPMNPRHNEYLRVVRECQDLYYWS